LEALAFNQYVGVRLWRKDGSWRLCQRKYFMGFTRRCKCITEQSMLKMRERRSIIAEFHAVECLVHGQEVATEVQYNDGHGALDMPGNAQWEP